HARGGRARGFGAFELDHAALEHRDVGVGKARIEKAGLLALEPRLALLGAVVDEALRQEQRFGRFPELRAQGAGMNQPGFGTIAGGSFSLRHVTSVVTTLKMVTKNRPGKISTGRYHTCP